MPIAPKNITLSVSANLMVVSVLLFSSYNGYDVTLAGKYLNISLYSRSGVCDVGFGKFWLFVLFSWYNHMFWYWSVDYVNVFFVSTEYLVYIKFTVRQLI